MAGLGCYGPLIDLSATPIHIGDYVQLLVFVHRTNPLHYKLARGGNLIRTDIHVGDDTRPFFCVSIWDKHLSSSIFAAHIVLLRNVEVVKFGNSVEAKTGQYSSVVSLIHPYTSLLSKGVDELISSCQVGGTANEKLRRVIQWVQCTRSTLCNGLKVNNNRPAIRNWKVQQDQTAQTCSSLSEVLHLTTPCKAVFHGSIGEMFLPSAWNDSEKERMFIRRQLNGRIDKIVEDIICTGCQLCGCTLSSDSVDGRKTSLSCCSRSSNRLHVPGMVYRPFMLYIWDNSDYLPLLVTNKAAEILFGNIRAEIVYQSYRGQKNYRSLANFFEAARMHKHKAAKERATDSWPDTTVGSQIRGENHATGGPNFYLIWLIVLKMMLQGGNSPLKFEANVNPSLEMEDGRFELITVSFPCVDSNGCF